MRASALERGRVICVRPAFLPPPPWCMNLQVGLATNLFGGLSKTPAPGHAVPVDPCVFVGSDIRLRV
jgi:hypothetical protein